MRSARALSFTARMPAVTSECPPMNLVAAGQGGGWQRARFGAAAGRACKPVQRRVAAAASGRPSPKSRNRPPACLLRMLTAAAAAAAAPPAAAATTAAGPPTRGHGDVGAQVQGALVDAGEDRVVHAHQRARGVRHLRHSSTEQLAQQLAPARGHAVRRSPARPGCLPLQRDNRQPAARRLLPLLASQMAATSQICMRGLVGDSSMTSLVLPGMMAACTALRHDGVRRGGVARGGV